jgi:uncharacterized RDD family membrane protein YckC
LAFTVVRLCFAAVVVLTYSSHDLSVMKYLDFGKAISGFNWPYSKWIRSADGIWGWSEIIVLLTNEKRRALHDFLAGTVVTQEPPNSRPEVDSQD